MNISIDAPWVRVGWAAAGMAVLLPLLALWTALPGASGTGPLRRSFADGADPASLSALGRTLTAHFDDAVYCVGDAGAAMARLTDKTPAASRKALEGELEECWNRRRHMTGMQLLVGTEAGTWPKPGEKPFFGDEPTASASTELLTAVLQARRSGRVVYAALPDARNGRSPGLVQVVPLHGAQAATVLLYHRLTTNVSEGPFGTTSPVRHPAFLVGAGPDARGIPLPALGDIRLVGDGDSWWPEWARDTRGLAWLLTAMTVALLGGALITQRALERQDRLRSDIERSVQVGLRAVDPDGRIIWANQAFLDMVQWPADKIIGSREPFVFWQEAERPERQDQWNTVVNGELSGDTYTSTFVRGDGRRIPVRVTAHPMKGRVGWMLASTDMSSEVESSKRVAGLLSTLGRLSVEAERVRQRLLKVHHHHGTTLAVVSMCDKTLNALNSDQADLARTRAVDALEVANASEHEAFEILHSSRPEECELVSLWDLVQTSFAMAEPMTMGENIQFINELSQDLPLVSVRRTTLVLILANLIHNGARAMAGESMSHRQLTIASAEVPGQERIQLLIRDRGHGIPPGVDIFERSADRKPSGNGVGLSYSREALRDWGGNLLVGESRAEGPWKGTVMVVELPLSNEPKEIENA